MRLNFNHPFLLVILICNALVIGRTVTNSNVPLGTKLLFVVLGTVWASLASLSKNYLDSLEEERNV